MNKIVIVEDSILIREGLKKIIPWENMECEIVAEAEDGQEGLEEIAKHNPQIVITDIRMDDMDGLEMIEKSKIISPKTLFIILTGHREFDYACKAVELHAFAYLLKPIDSDVLCEKIKAAVEYIESSKIDDYMDLLSSTIEEIQNGSPKALELYSEYLYKINSEDFEKKKSLLGNLLYQIFRGSRQYNENMDILQTITSEKEICDFSEKIRSAIEQELECQVVQEEDHGEIVNQMLNYIHDNYMNNITIKDIAENCGYSGYYGSKIFKNKMSCSVAEYLTKYRIECAKKMIEENKTPIKNIAMLCGFSDVNYFYKVFKRYVGKTTIEYKMSLKG